MRGFFALFFLCLIAVNAEAVTWKKTNDLAIGNFVQTAEHASCKLETSGALACNGLKAESGSGQKAESVGNIYFETEVTTFGGTETLNIPNPADVVLKGNGCTVTFSNITPSQSSGTFNRKGAWIGGLLNELNVTFGADITIDGWCKGGDTAFSGVISIPYTSSNNRTALLPVRMGISFHLGITESQPLNFGALLSPQTNSTVTLSPEGIRSAPPAMLYASAQNAYSAGRFNIVSGGDTLSAVLVLPESASIASGANTLGVSNFTARLADGSPVASGAPFTLNNGDTLLFTGATLHVPANTPAGEYSGSYVLTISY